MAKVKACSSSSCRPLRELFTKALVRVREPFLCKRSRSVLLPELLDEKFADSQYQECLLLKQDDLSGCVGIGMGHVRLTLRGGLPVFCASSRAYRLPEAVPTHLFVCPYRKDPPMSRASKTLVEFAEQMARVAPAVEPFGSIRERPHARRVPLSGVRACSVALPQRHAPRRHLSGVRQTCRDSAPCAGPRAAGTLRPHLLSSRRAVSQPVSR